MMMMMMMMNSGACVSVVTVTAAAYWSGTTADAPGKHSRRATDRPAGALVAASLVRANKHKCVCVCSSAMTLAPCVVHHLLTISRVSGRRAGPLDTGRRQMRVDSDVNQCCVCMLLHANHTARYLHRVTLAPSHTHTHTHTPLFTWARSTFSFGN